VKTGIKFYNTDETFPPLEFARMVEDHGIESIWLPDHSHVPVASRVVGENKAAYGDVEDQRTRRFAKSPSPDGLPREYYRNYDQMISIAMMGCLYPGRIMLGVGSGEALNEIAVGYKGEWPDFKERFARLRESVRLMRELWLGDRVDFGASTTRPRAPRSTTSPKAASRSTVVRYAGRAGDGFICTSGKGMELYTDKLLPAVEEGAAKAERDAGEIDKMIEIKISYDTDPEVALENTRFWAPLSLTPEQKHSIDDPIEMEKAADELPVEQVAKRWIVASDPDEAVEKVKLYTDAGLNHLVFHAPGHNQKRFLELFEHDLAPRLRELKDNVQT